MEQVDCLGGQLRRDLSMFGDRAEQYVGIALQVGGQSPDTVGGACLAHCHLRQLSQARYG